MDAARRLPAQRLLVAFGIVLHFSLGGLSAEIPLTVTEPSGVARSQWPVTSGVPMAQGELLDPANCALFHMDGREIPLQTEVLARWPDGSVRWLLLDFQVSLAANQDAKLVLRHAADQRRARIAEPRMVAVNGERLTLNSGPVRIELAAQSFRLLDAVWFDRNGDRQHTDDERVTASHEAGIVLTTPDGQQFRADLSRAEMSVEQAGPLRGCVRITGHHSSAAGKMYRYIVRMHVYRGQPFVKLCYTFVNDHQSSVMSKIDALELVFTARDTSRDSQFLVDGRPSGPARLFQVDDDRYEVDGQRVGRRATGWAAIRGERGGLAVGVREFWQNWPKSLSGDVITADQAAQSRSPAMGQLRVGICPQFPRGLYDDKPIKEEAKLYYYLRNGEYSFKIGVSRTHDLWVNFFAGQPVVGQLADFFRTVDQPLLAQPLPAYVSSTVAAGRFPPALRTARYSRYDDWVAGLFDLHLEDLERVREYGMLNFGDWYNIKWDSWGNQEYDTARCFLTQYLRTGDRRFFDRGSQAARHYLDVDIVHEVSGPLHEYAGSAKMRPGHVWLHQVGHTGGYYGRYEGGKYHDEAPLLMKGAYQVGMYNWGHQWIGGVFDYYLLTGDRRALEVGMMTANTIAAECPTRYSDHIRDLGWPLNLVIAAYEATGEKRYLEAAERQWKLLEQHFDPVQGFQVLLAYGHCSALGTAERCRGQNAYMFGLTLSGLARYHRLSQDPDVLHGLTVGIQQLIRECWSEEHKSFYLTSCQHNRGNPPPALCSATALASEAMAYESALTGNAEHLRIFRDAFETMVNAGLESVARGDPQGQTGYASMMFHFTPYSLWALE